MNEDLQTLEVKVENNGTTPQGKIFAREWNVMVEAVKALDLKEFDEAKLLQYLRDNDFITSEDIPDVDFSNVVTLSGQQTISGPKDFVGGIKVNGMPLTYNSKLGVWEFTGDLLVTGAVTMFGSLSGFKPSTIMDAVQVDNETIIKVKDAQGNWVLRAPGGGGSGGTGGGIDVNAVNVLISDALVGYATQDWVGDNYLSSSGGTINGTINYNENFTAETLLTHGLGYNRQPILMERDWTATDGDILRFRPAGYSLNNKFLEINSTGHVITNCDITAPSVIGNLTGNADSATNADKLDDFHSYDFVRANSRILAGSDINHIGYGYPDNNCMTAGPMISFGANSTYFAEIQAYLGHNRLLYREHNSDGYGNPKTFAFTDSNVASATKLEVSQMLWGKPFDGTNSIDGDIFPSTSGCYFNINGISQHSNYGWIRDVLLVNSLGDIAVVGNITVHGSAIVDDRLFTKNGIEVAGDVLAPLTLTPGGWEQPNIITRGWTSEESDWLALHVVGATTNTAYFKMTKDKGAYLNMGLTINGNLLATGAITTPQINIGGLAAYKLQDDTLFIDANVVVRGAISMFGVNTLAEMESIEQRLLSLEQKVEQLSV